MNVFPGYSSDTQGFRAIAGNFPNLHELGFLLILLLAGRNPRTYRGRAGSWNSALGPNLICRDNRTAWLVGFPIGSSEKDRTEIERMGNLLSGHGPHEREGLQGSR